MVVWVRVTARGVRTCVTQTNEKKERLVAVIEQAGEYYLVDEQRNEHDHVRAHQSITCKLPTTGEGFRRRTQEVRR